MIFKWNLNKRMGIPKGGIIGQRDDHWLAEKYSRLKRK